MSGEPAWTGAPLPLSQWRQLLRDPYFREGLRDITGTSLGVAAWGLVTGVAMAKSGMGSLLAVLMTLTVYAGSAQLAVLPLFMAHSPMWVVWLTATCVNLRFIIFSSMWRNFFGHLPRGRRLALGYFSGDVIFALFFKRFPEQRPGPGQEAYFWGAAVSNWVAWQVPCIAGVFLADAIPVHWGLGFAGVLALLGVALSMLSDRLTALAAGIAACGAVAAFALPLKLNILVAIAAAVAVCLAAESLAPRPSRIVRRSGGAAGRRQK